MTYTWSLSWANVDKGFFVEQETMAGFWSPELQVKLLAGLPPKPVPIQEIYDSVFPDNPRAIRSLHMEDWDLFSSPWAHKRSDEEVTLPSPLSLSLSPTPTEVPEHPRHV